MLPLVTQKVKTLPEDFPAEIEHFWVGGKPPNETSTEHAAKQYLKHVVQGDVFTVDFDVYWEKAVEFSKIFTHELLLEVMSEDYDESRFYDCRGLIHAFSEV